MTKTMVSLVSTYCTMCGTKYDEAIGIDKYCRERLDPKINVYEGICKECQDKIDKGYQIVVEIDESKSSNKERRSCESTVYHGGDVYRTGRICAINRSVISEPFNKHTCIFVGNDGTYDLIVKQATGGES